DQDRLAGVLGRLPEGQSDGQGLPEGDADRAAQRGVGRDDGAAEVEGSAAKNSASFTGSSRPPLRTLLHKSKPNGCTVSTASATLPALRPPARNSGTPMLARIRA